MGVSNSFSSSPRFLTDVFHPIHLLENDVTLQVLFPTIYNIHRSALFRRLPLLFVFVIPPCQRFSRTPCICICCLSWCMFFACYTHLAVDSPHIFFLINLANAEGEAFSWSLSGLCVEDKCS